jgi:predicted RNA-binding Zn ribbon-like protein
VTTSPRLGQGPVVDLLNTVWADRAGVHDALADDEVTLRELRDAVRVLAADRTADPRPVAAGHGERVAGAVDVVNRVSALAPSWPVLVDGRPALEYDTTESDRALGALAADAVRLFGSDVELRACLAPGCVLYFIKDHPRRSWCSTACGNRERAARHYARHRGGHRDGQS